MIPPATDTVNLQLDLMKHCHCTVEPIDNPDLIFPVTFNGTPYTFAQALFRLFLETVSLQASCGVYCIQRVYVMCLDLLDPKKKHIKHRLFRESCVICRAISKDLHVLGRDYSRTALVDNSPHAMAFKFRIGIPIESWFDDDTDIGY